MCTRLLQSYGYQQTLEEQCSQVGERSLKKILAQEEQGELHCHIGPSAQENTAVLGLVAPS